MSSSTGAHEETGATGSPSQSSSQSSQSASQSSTGDTQKPAEQAFSTDASLQAHAKGGGASGNQGSNKSNHKTWLWILIAIVVVVALVAVFVVVRNARSGNDQTAEGGKPADSVSVGLKLAPANLDIRNQSGSALDQALIGNVYEGLVARDRNNEVVPGLAKSWEQSRDGLTYTFHLNKNMSFSNGDTLDASDVAWSINELVAHQYHDSEMLQHFKSIEATDPQTVKLTLSAPYSNTLWVLTGRPGLVFDKDAHYDAKTQAVGSGPYTISRFVPNSSLTFSANEKYWGPNRARTKTVILRYFTDDNAAVNALKSGDVQALAPITENLAAPFAKDAAHYTVKVGEGTDKYVLAMNSKGAKTSDIRVRQAIRAAIDHKAIIASRGGADKLMGGPIPSLDPGYEDLGGRVAKPDPAKARKLLGEAGYSTSHPLTLRLEYANTYGTELGDQLRSQLKAVGIDLKVNVVEFSTWMQDVYTNKDYDLSLVDHSESHDFSQWVNTKYYYNYDNAKVRSLYDEAMAAHSGKDRDAKLRAAARLVSDDAPADWLFNYRITTAMAKGLTGLPVNLNQTLLPLANVAYTPDK